MADRKEIIDYLRNCQKAAEIDAKVNGINIWVLLGAIGLISWQLLDNLSAELWNQRDQPIKFLIICEVAYFFTLLCAPSEGLRDDLRFSGDRMSATDSPLLIIIEGFWIGLPIAMLYILGPLSISIVLLGIIALIPIGRGSYEIFLRVIGEINEYTELPEPSFRNSSRTDAAVTVSFAFMLAFIFVDQLVSILSGSLISVNVLKALILSGALYLLVLIAIRRRRRTFGIQWTYELETDLLVGAISIESALMRIEHRALGPKLEDVMNRFFLSLDSKISNLSKNISTGDEILASIKDIPVQFEIERRDRIEKATSQPKAEIEEISNDIKRLSAYIEKLRKSTDKRVPGLIDGLVSKRKLYKDKITEEQRRLDEIVYKATR